MNSKVNISKAVEIPVPSAAITANGKLPQLEHHEASKEALTGGFPAVDSLGILFERHRAAWDFDCVEWDHFSNIVECDAMTSAPKLTQISEETRRIKDACGLTDAERRINESSSAVKSIEREVLNFVPTTLEEASRKAQWILHKLKDSEETYLRDDADTLHAALTSIARAMA
ncbi:hypothetical protein FHX10_004560 [Rhizobium sp. BK591]|uniref:hypothetical protein n=1 Tax=Rhizobium sp. BK591 TaxID=2586985 RepID=UPI00161CC0D5|nr:hypothetical protein [Rhizobium sp. BK591]MBB3745023.1 hypothetical protein [Rhizobium sp. BK591]